MAAAADKNKKADAKDKKSRSPMLMIAIVAVVAAAAAGGGAWYFAHQGKDDKDAAKHAPATSTVPAPAQYFAMEPPFVVNLNGPIDGPRYLQVEVQLMTRDPIALKNIESNAPAIRARLLMLFSQVQPAEIADRAGKEKLQAAALAEVQKLLRAETGDKCAQELLFTSFVTQ
ncbi:MAG TPA: flagellar basal body-associated FliL family protein [Stenotrophomonas sp.]|nr:flagellar basal body-associated FliL family protein [Stenotrophomonas sp.]